MNWLDRKMENGIRKRLAKKETIDRNKSIEQLKRDIRKSTKFANFITLVLMALAIMFFWALYPSLFAILFVDGGLMLYVFLFRYGFISDRVKLKLALEGKEREKKLWVECGQYLVDQYETTIRNEKANE